MSAAVLLRDVRVNVRKRNDREGGALCGVVQYCVAGSVNEFVKRRL
jgi:hypothetical protein